MARTTANRLLLLAAFFWGMGNIAQKLVLDHVDPLTAVSLRCLIGAAVVLPLVMFEPRGAAQPGFLVSLIRVALAFGLALGVQQTAFLSTSVTNASFLINTCVVLVPLVVWAYTGLRPERLVVAAAAVTLAGSFLMAGGQITRIAPGDLAALVSAVFYAFWTVELARHAQRHGRPFATAFGQFLLTGVLFLPAASLTGGMQAEGIMAALPELLALGLFPTALAFAMQTCALRYTEASSAAVLVSAESVFGALGAFLFLGERPPALAWAGMALILTAITLVARQEGRPEERPKQRGAEAAG